MFTGIIQSIASIKKHEYKNGSLVLTIATPAKWKLEPGDSIATDGVCLTVTKVGKGFYQTELVEETLQRTTFGKLIPVKVNLERPLRPTDFLDGHIVQGHVDAVGEIKQITLAKISPLRQAQDRLSVPPLIGEGERLPPPTRGRTQEGVFTIHFPKKYSRLIVEKGSITVDGISLTVVDVGTDWFSVALIPYTLKETTIGLKRVWDFVNLEFDVIAKYILKNKLI